MRQRLFFYILFVILIILTLVMLKSYLTVIIVSLISVIMLKPVYDYFIGRKWVGERKGLASSLTLIALLVILILPVILIIVITTNQLSGLFEQLAEVDLDAALQSAEEFIAGLPLKLPLGGLDVNVTDAFQSIARAVAQGLADLLVSVGASLPSLLMQAVIFLVVVATLLPVYDVLIPQMEEISPLGPELSELYNRKTTAMVKSLIFGVFLIAIIQGVAMGFFYWIAGLPYIFLFVLLSIVLAMIPMVGISWLVIALAVISFLAGNWQQAAIVLFGFYGVVNWIDILLRPKLLSEDASISFALFILSIFGGLAWAGIMGLFYGPVIMLLLVTTIQVYAERFANEDVGFLDEAIENLRANRSPEEPVPEGETVQA